MSISININVNSNKKGCGVKIIIIFLWERDKYTDGKSHNLQIVDNLVTQYTWQT